MPGELNAPTGGVTRGVRAVGALRSLGTAVGILLQGNGEGTGLLAGN